MTLSREVLLKTQSGAYSSKLLFHFEQEKKQIQDVIRERVMVEKKTVEEEEKIKDTRELGKLCSYSF